MEQYKRVSSPLNQKTRTKSKMASQVAHIVYAHKYFGKIEKGKLPETNSAIEKIKESPARLDRDEFMLGCVFPDIRRIDENIRRKDTHLKFQPLNLDFSGLSPFEAGWKFHLYCDMRREEILNKHGFYSIKNSADFAGGPAKLLEDELAYGDYGNWEKIAGYFNDPPFLISDNLGVSRETYNLWYAILSKYVKKQPDNKTIRIFISKLLDFSSSVDQVVERIDSLRKNKKAAEILLKIKEEIV